MGLGSLLLALTMVTVTWSDLATFQRHLDGQGSQPASRQAFMEQYRWFHNRAPHNQVQEGRGSRAKRWWKAMMGRGLLDIYARRLMDNKLDKLEVGFCEGAPQTGSIDLASVSPFPVAIAQGASVALTSQFTLRKEIPEGVTVTLNIKKKEPWWAPNIHIPCIDVEGMKIGSCTYPLSWLLARAAPHLPPHILPDGQACKLPLLPGVYGGPDPVMLGPIRHLPPLIAQLIPSGEYDAKVELHTREGALLTCLYSRVKLTGTRWNGKTDQ